MSEEKTNVVVEEEQTEDEKAMAAVVHGENDPIITVKKLLEAGVHFGHPTRKWNPKMKQYIYTPRNGIYIIDLVQTVSYISKAYLALKDIVTAGGKILFVGTKQQIASVVEEEAVRSGSFYMNHRWLGGVLTNFRVIQTRIKYLKDLELLEADGSIANKTKKEATEIKKQKEKLMKNLEGIKEMRKIPQAIVVVDPSVEYNAIREANKLNIPVFAIVDTNCSPEGIEYVIPGNDDAAKSVKLILQVLADAIVEAKGGVPTVAYTKDEGEEATMKDVVAHADRENAIRMAAIREQRQARKEAMEKALAERAARYRNRQQSQKQEEKPAVKEENKGENK